MERILNGENLSTEAWRVSDEEAASLQFAARLYIDRIHAIVASDSEIDPLEADDRLSIVTDFISDLEEDRPVLAANQCEMALDIFIPYAFRLYDVTKTNNGRRRWAKDLEISYDELMTHYHALAGFLDHTSYDNSIVQFNSNS